MNATTRRGFTSHEHLDSSNLIHMNGRVYDPQIGRFISADPFVQAPFFSQSLNRYSYTFNGPLSYVDPSGFGSEPPDPDDMNDDDGWDFNWTLQPTNPGNWSPTDWNPGRSYGAGMRLALMRSIAWLFPRADGGDPSWVDPAKEASQPVGIANSTPRDFIEGGVLVLSAGGTEGGSLGMTGGSSSSAWALLGISSASAADQGSAPLGRSGSLIGDYYSDVSDAGLLTRILVGIGTAPIPKRLFGFPVVGTASTVTNPISLFGLKAFPNLKSPVPMLGSNRIFGIAGRANVLLATGLASYDATSIVLSIPLNEQLTIGDKINQVLLDPFFTYP